MVVARLVGFVWVVVAGWFVLLVIVEKIDVKVANLIVVDCKVGFCMKLRGSMRVLFLNSADDRLGNMVVAASMCDGFVWVLRMWSLSFSFLAEFFPYSF